MGGIVALPGILHKTHTALTWRRTSRGRGGSPQVHRHTRTHTVSRVPLPASRCCCTVVGGPVKCVSKSVEVMTHKLVGTQCVGPLKTRYNTLCAGRTIGCVTVCIGPFLRCSSSLRRSAKQANVLYDTGCTVAHCVFFS